MKNKTPLSSIKFNFSNKIVLNNFARFYNTEENKNPTEKEDKGEKEYEKLLKKLKEKQEKSAQGEDSSVWERIEKKWKANGAGSEKEDKEKKENENETKENETKDPKERAKEKEETRDEMNKKYHDKPKEEKEGEEDDPFKKNKNYIILAAIITFGLVYSIVEGKNSNKITFNEFQNQILPKGIIDSISVENQEVVRIVLKEPYNGKNFVRMQIGNVSIFEHKLHEAQLLNGTPQEQHIVVNYSKTIDFIPFINAAVLLGALIGISFLSYTRTAGSSNIFTKSMSKSFQPVKDVKVKFADVAGHNEAKQEVSEFVSFLTDPKRFKALGARTPKGALLIGPPGSGKTLLAKAVAGEANVPFYSVSGSDFVEMFVGVGPQRVRELFKTARKTSPCIIFIDEIDAIGRARSDSGGGNDERENTLHQLLVEMDGFEKEGDIIVLASTNRADILDKALMRPGRFDRQIAIDNPDFISRKEILAVHMKKIKVDPTLDQEKLIEKIALLTPGFSGADLANVCNEAALVSARNLKESVSFIELEYAIDRVIAGMERKTRVLSEEEKKVVAYHEAGHAISGWFLKHVDPLLKVSIIPRGESTLGFAQYNPQDQYLYTQDQLMDRICMALGGRVAEEIFFEKITTGASDDLRRVTDMAYSQILMYGMNDKVGPISFPRFGNLNELGKPYSEKTALLIDNEVKTMVDKAYERTKKLLLEKRDLVESLAQLLIKDEVVSKDQIEALVGPREIKNFTPPNPSLSFFTSMANKKEESIQKN